MPQLNRTLDDDTECIDDPHGLQTETWLASTLPTWVKHTFAVAPGRGSWATLGYSLGAVSYKQNTQPTKPHTCRSRW